jgi:hypothetical protein
MNDKMNVKSRRQYIFNVEAQSDAHIVFAVYSLTMAKPHDCSSAVSQQQA